MDILRLEQRHHLLRDPQDLRRPPILYIEDGEVERHHGHVIPDPLVQESLSGLHEEAFGRHHVANPAAIFPAATKAGTASMAPGTGGRVQRP
jgi:hypothetical protein